MRNLYRYELANIIESFTITITKEIQLRRLKNVQDKSKLQLLNIKQDLSKYQQDFNQMNDKLTEIIKNSSNIVFKCDYIDKSVQTKDLFSLRNSPICDILVSKLQFNVKSSQENYFKV